MRKSALLILCAACSEWRMRPLTAPYVAAAPLVQEQALVGLDPDGNVAALQLVEAEGMPPSLELWRLDRDGGPSRLLLAAAGDVAAGVAAAVRERGRTRSPLLLEAAKRPWADAFARANALGFESLLPDVSDARSHGYLVAAPGDLPCVLRTVHTGGDPPSYVVLLAEAAGSGDEVEIARQPTAGDPAVGGVWIRNSTAWLLSGSVGRGDPLRRTIALRRGSIARGAAEILLAHGRAERAKGDLDSARLSLGRAVTADPRFVDALYAAAALDAVSGRPDAAVSLLRRAAEVDRRRVQVLGRDDADLVSLRNRQDVRKLLGLPSAPAG
ncbi:MAG: tetratricopeptide repeat protein [Myxococcales bacterium]